MIIGPRGLVKAACFYAQLLGVSDFELEIERTHLKGCTGICTQFTETEYVIRLDPRRYFREDPIYEILAHEMVHLKQYIKGELIDLTNWATQWKGDIYKDNIPYEQLPWEIEAFSMQKSLYKEYKRELLSRTNSRNRK